MGRGCLFGPVFAAAVILDPDRPIRGLNDSKQLSAAERERLNIRIRERSLAWAVACIDAYGIDRHNIYQASRRAMTKAVEKLRMAPDFLYVDALTLDLPIAQRALIKGDARCASIAAASIVAKVERDRCLAKWHELFDGYALDSNKGYCAPDHFAGLDTLGPVSTHRYSFEPVRQAAGLGQRSLF